jgi:hypothetical protein
MRKAFDANVPKLRPRLKNALVETVPEGAAAGEVQAGEVAPMEPAVEAATPTLSPQGGEREVLAEPATLTATPTPTLSPPSGEREVIVEPATAQTKEPSPSPWKGEGRGEGPGNEEPSDLDLRRERLAKIKRRVAEAARPAPVVPALPETPARAGESALALVRELEAQLARAREVEEALRADLDAARGELARGAAEGRRGAERLAAAEAQVGEKRAVLTEMLSEMSALEEERDGAVARAQALSALDEERQALLDGTSSRAEAAEKARAEAEAEIGRLGAELDGRAADAARLRGALAQVTRERDDLARELGQARRERDELQEARHALEQVHEALAHARTRLG